MKRDLVGFFAAVFVVGIGIDGVGSFALAFTMITTGAIVALGLLMRIFVAFDRSFNE